MSLQSDHYPPELLAAILVEVLPALREALQQVQELSAMARSIAQGVRSGDAGNGADFPAAEHLNSP